MVWILAMRRWLGDAGFDAYYENIAAAFPNNKEAFAPWKFEIRYDMATKPGEPEYVPDPQTPGEKRLNAREEILPGDRVQFPNPGGHEPWHNENTIYLGMDEHGRMWFFAHPFGIRTADEILDELARIYRRSALPGEPKPYMDPQVLCSPDFEWIWRYAHGKWRSPKVN